MLIVRKNASVEILPEIGYEVGTEETNGGLTSTEKYREFIEKTGKRVEGLRDCRCLPLSSGRGTLTRKTEQVGTYNFHNAYDLAAWQKHTVSD